MRRTKIVCTIGPASCTADELDALVRAGMDAGMIQLKVEGTSPTAVRCRVIAGGRISDHKGVSFPHVPLPVSCLTSKDREDLRFGIHGGIDFVAVSFVRSAADIAEVRKYLHEQGADLPIVAKLERQEVMAN